MINERLIKALEITVRIYKKNERKFNRLHKICQGYYNTPRYLNYLRKNKNVALSIWAYKVKQRDNFICLKCSRIDFKLHAHHILPKLQYHRQSLDIDNGVTMCAPCHIAFHKQYGKFNNTKEQINEYVK